MTLQLGVIGASGYWGRKTLGALSALPGVAIRHCAGYSDRERLEAVVAGVFLGRERPSMTLAWKEVTSAADVDGVVICAPAEMHYAIAKDALANGKHVFVEKPFCLKAEHGRDLAQLAADKDRALHVDHTYLFSDCLRFMKERIDDGELGRIIYFHSNRTQMGIYRSHSALWDLGPHDVAMVRYLFPEEVLAEVRALGQSTFDRAQGRGDKPVEDTVFFSLRYRSGFRASAYLSWCHAKRARDVVVMGERQMLLFENNNQVSVFKHNLSVSTRAGEAKSELVDKYLTHDDPLRNSLACFTESATRGRAYLPSFASADFACDTLTVLDSVAEAMRQSG